MSSYVVLLTDAHEAPAYELIEALRVAGVKTLIDGLREVEVWGRTVDTKIFAPSRFDHNIRRLHGWEHKFVLLHVGRLAAEKGVQRILDAFRIARGLLPAGSLHLVIAGLGEEITARKAELKVELGLEDDEVDSSPAHVGASGRKKTRPTARK